MIRLDQNLKIKNSLHCLNIVRTMFTHVACYITTIYDVYNVYNNTKRDIKTISDRRNFYKIES